ncbi:MAG: hypothetical protein V9E90_03055 [Saprospiraceae bacterium]
MKHSLNILMLLAIAISAFGQKKTQVAVAKNGLFIKSCERVSAGMQSCTLCEDKELKKNCKTYTCDDAGQCAQFKMGNLTLKSLIQSAKVQNIKGIQKEATGVGLTDYYIQEGDTRTYIFRNETTLSLDAYTVPKGTKIAARPSQPSPENKSCINDCINIGNLCDRNCGSSTLCLSECKKSRLACARICNKFVPKSTLSISIKGTGGTSTLNVFN